MRGDETQSATAADGAAVARRGPRHAAPRKSLLNKIQGPAGKAMALAAMPTAVLMGMGMAPRLALADEKDIPFAPGPCVTRSDEPVAEESTKPAETPKPTASASATESPKPEATEEESPKPTASPSTTATAGPDAGEQQAPAPTSTPTPTKSTNPLDPLGIGDKIKDIFDGPDATPTATPTPTASATKPATEKPAEKPPATEPADKPSTTAPDAGKTTTGDDPVDTTKDAIEKAAGKVGAKVKELPEDAKGLDAKKDEEIPDGAKPRFPCPEPDPEALAAAELEPGLPLLPDEPWKLESSLLTLKGLKYHGIVEVKTGSGKIKKALKFTASEVDIKDLHQLTVHSEGNTGHVRSDRGSTSTIRNGTVTMYTEQLKGNLFGLIPITFNPQTPPPLDVPFAFFTNVEVIQAGQFGGTLRVPGLRNTVEPS
ncbi:hypothetical protein M5362_14505 [Streptomyces sp. Je 1-79]|uniref:hypothetical protein n=1 Tax=Streptomyces sp. Je 1-79 TaxID=2943847 RepID=UPI0021A62513|nr:hypothetical protein [Streptomyces sp. Je 1-79]MCT4354343.1 hypothetical protein [Streptomyces sp. Je 1-79]